MIQLTRLNYARLAVNCDLIKYVEAAPDTVLTLINDEKLVVRETTEQVIERVRQFRRSILRRNRDFYPAGDTTSATPRTGEGEDANRG